MKAVPSSPGTSARSDLPARTFRLSWSVLAAIALALYLGWGSWHPGALLPLLPAAFLVRGLGDHRPIDFLGPWRRVLISAALFCAAGFLLLPRQPSPSWLARHDVADRARLEQALQTLHGTMARSFDEALAVLPAGDTRVPPAGWLEQVWTQTRARFKTEALALTWLGTEPGSPLWAGSAWLVPVELPPRSPLGPGPAGDRFTITGDSLAAMAILTRPVGNGTLVMTALVLRAPGAPGPCPGSRSYLETILPARILQRLQVGFDREDSGGGLRVSLGSVKDASLSYPLRAPAQAILLVMVLVGSLALLGRDTSAIRGIAAAPLIYAAVVPFVLGAFTRPLSLDLIAPSWSGHQLTNQAFLAVSAAALALWFALSMRNPLAERGRSLTGTIICLLLILGLWPLGLSLLGDLFRFAPSWFWARVSFLPGARDLIGWLIAIAMTLTIITGAGGAAALLRRYYGLVGLIGTVAAAAVGAGAAAVGGLWRGAVVVGVLTAAAGTLGVALWLQVTLQRPVLTRLLGLGVIGALLLLPLKTELGRRITHQVLESAAASLSSAGVGLDPADFTALREDVRGIADRLAQDGDSNGFRNADRQAFLIWRELDLERHDRAGGVQMLTSDGEIAGGFTTAATLFDLVLSESMRHSACSGQGRFALAAGEQTQFGEETLILAVHASDRGRPFLIGVRPRPLGFVADGEERIWSLTAAPDAAGRAGRFAGELFVHVYDETFGLLAVPRSHRPTPVPATVPAAVIEHLHESDVGRWYRRGWWLTGGADEYYFRLETSRAGSSLSGVAIGEIGTVERVACLGMEQPGLWGRLIETLQILLLFLLALLILGWLPAAAFARSGVPLSTSVRRVSFRTRLIIPLLVVALLPLVALWLLTRGFVLTRERAGWESGLEENVRVVEQAVTERTAVRARELARDAEHVSSFGFTIPADGMQWALFDANLVRTTGTLADSLAERIPLRDVVHGRWPQSFIFRAGALWSASVASLGDRFSAGAALVIRPFTTELLREATTHIPWHTDLFLDGRVTVSTNPSLYTAGVLPRVLPPEADWEGAQGREVGAFSWGDIGSLDYLFAYRPLTDYSGLAVATLACRRFGFWGLNDPAVHRLFTTVASIYLLLVAAVTLVAVLTARMISRPIGDLTGSARRVAGGDLEVEIPVTRGDEVGGLQKAFRQMVIALRENRDELARAERERAWQEMARQVAHEIKNPLTPMQLSAQFLRRAYDEGAEDLGKILHECTDAIVEQVEGLRRIANEFSTYARLPVVRHVPTDLNEPVEDALNLFEPALPDGVTIIRDLAPRLPEAPLDPEQIRRVAINLMRNALDAMGESGRLTVRTGADATHVWLEVTDTGEGIAPEVQERLFEPYFSTRTDGTGLGLAITRAIVDAYEGEISIDSRPGEGTIVLTRFPFL